MPCFTGAQQVHLFQILHHTQKSEVTCFNSYTNNLPPLFYDGVQLPYTFKYFKYCPSSAWFVTDINLNTAADAALCPFTAGTFCIKQFIQEHDLTNRLHIYMWPLKTFAFLLVCMQARLGHPIITTGQRNGQLFT